MELIASGHRVRDRRRLNREYGRGAWRKGSRNHSSPRWYDSRSRTSLIRSAWHRQKRDQVQKAGCRLAAVPSGGPRQPLHCAPQLQELSPSALKTKGTKLHSSCGKSTRSWKIHSLEITSSSELSMNLAKITYIPHNSSCGSSFLPLFSKNSRKLLSCGLTIPLITFRRRTTSA